MSTRVTVAGHPIHPMLVTIPIGLWVFSLICDFGYIISGDERWTVTAYFTLGGGIIGALIAAVPGLVDLLGIHDARAQRVGIYHLVLNLGIVVLQAISFWLRTEEGLGAVLPRGIAIVAVAVLIISGWLGGQLVHVLGVTQPRHLPESVAEPTRHDQLHPRT
jgi:uncharacterized membrane protein